MVVATAWHIRGSYFESCNCDAICPCRRIDGVSGGRSTHGICLGVLTWLIEEGEAVGTDLAGLPVALATRYDDDEPGSPWTWILYLDEREFFDRTRLRWKAPLAMLAGMAASVPFWDQGHPIPLGYIPKHHPAVGDLSFFVGFAVAALVYLALNARSVQARLRTGTRAATTPA